MNNTLYISDLDGTLLNNQARISPYTREIINKFIAKGGKFSVATGRSYESAKDILKDLNLQLPIVFSNGVSTYDPVENQYINITHYTEQALAALDQILDEHDMRGFFFMMQDDVAHLFHKPLRTPLEEEYKRVRASMYDNITEHSDILALSKEYMPFFCVVYGDRESMNAVANQIDHTPGLQTALYSDVYNDNFFMDVFPSDASKLHGMQTVQKISRANRTVSFGDNYNDLPMLEGANESYATAGAVAEAKAVATGVIGDNNDDAVAKFLAERYGL